MTVQSYGDKIGKLTLNLMPNGEQKRVIESLEEVLLPKLEASLGRDDALALKDALREAEVNLIIEGKERESLFRGSQLRSRAVIDDEARKVTGVEVYYDRSAPEGRRWKPFDALAVPSQGYFEVLDEETGEMEMEDKSLGVMAVLGPARFKEFVVWCYEKSAEEAYPGRIGEAQKEGTRGRGLMQAAARLLAMACLNPDSPDFDRTLDLLNGEINTRLWRGLRQTLPSTEMQAVDRAFQSKGIKEPTEQTAGFSPALLPDLVRFLAKKTPVGQSENGQT